MGRQRTSRALERVARVRDRREAILEELEAVEKEFDREMTAARVKHGHSWGEIGEIAALSRYTVRYRVLKLNDRRKHEPAGA